MTNPNQSAVEELAQDATSRKRFLRAVGGSGAAAALGVLIAACGGDDKNKPAAAKPAPATSSDVKNDIEIVNYALTLEYLETQFYNDVIASGVVKDPKVGAIAKKFADSEQQHVDALIAAVRKLGGKPVAAPKASFQSVIEGGLEKVLSTAASVENLGAAAYLGQAGNIKNKEILAAALSIHSVEARHAAALNELIGGRPLPDGAFAKPMAKADVLKAVQPFLTA
jgi:rubrerythrin